MPVGGYSKGQRAGILRARGRVFYRRIPARWHLEDAITLSRGFYEKYGTCNRPIRLRDSIML